MVDASSIAPPKPMQRVLQQRNFVLLWAGQSTSLLGDQFYLVAAPWLVLKITGDPLALGTVLAAGAIPRAAMMLIGGAVSDRFSARKIMLASDLIRLVLILGLLFLVFSGLIQLWMLYFLSVLFGIVSGFFIPASNSIIPGILPGEDLQAGNSIFQGSSQLVSFIGPALAGVVIGSFAGEMRGIATAFGIDALTFVVSIATLWFMQYENTHLVEQKSEKVWVGKCFL